MSEPGNIGGTQEACGSEVPTKSTTGCSPGVHGWQPIETAPKPTGGALVQVDIWANGERVCDAYWLCDASPPGWYAPYQDHLDTGRIEGEPTHWMPLPSPPPSAGAP